MNIDLVYEMVQLSNVKVTPVV